MNYQGKDCDLLTLRADSPGELDELVKCKAAGREVIQVVRSQVFSRKDNKRRILAQAFIARESTV